MAALSPLDYDYYENALRYCDNDSNISILGTELKLVISLKMEMIAKPPCEKA
jgi:hypothetical protein